MTPEQRKQFAADVVDIIANFDDRNSPEDWPEAMLVTGDELQSVIAKAFEMHDERGETAALEAAGRDEDPKAMAGSHA